MENKSNKRAVFGVILVLIGALLIAHNFDFFPFNIRHIVFSWQMILIVIGLIILISSRESKTVGWILIVIGGFFLIPDIFNIPYSWGWRRLFWPLIFIVIGLLILFRGDRLRHRNNSNILGEDYIDDFAMFGGGHRIITSKNFKGGKVTSIFGGSQLNFREASLAKGKNVIDVFSLFGGSKFIVPRDWDIKVEVTSILGGFSDKRVPDPNVVYDPSKQLAFKGVLIFGGGEIQNY
jgi:predicted membrane protein